MNLKLKPTNVSKPWVWLEGLFTHNQSTFDMDTITIKYHNKNYKNLITKNKLKFKTLTNRHTFMTSQQAMAKVIGQIHRIRVTTLSYTNRLQALKEFRTIAIHLNYSQKTISNALKHVAKTTDEPVWNIINNRIDQTLL